MSFSCGPSVNLFDLDVLLYNLLCIIQLDFTNRLLVIEMVVIVGV